MSVKEKLYNVPWPVFVFFVNNYHKYLFFKNNNPIPIPTCICICICSWKSYIQCRFIKKKFSFTAW